MSIETIQETIQTIFFVMIGLLSIWLAYAGYRIYKIFSDMHK